MDLSHLQLLAKKRTQLQADAFVAPGQVRMFYRLDALQQQQPRTQSFYRCSQEREELQSLPPPPNIFASPAPSPSSISERSNTLTHSFHSAAAAAAATCNQHRNLQLHEGQHLNAVSLITDDHIHRLGHQQQVNLSPNRYLDCPSKYRHSSSSIDHKTLSLTSFEQSNRRRDSRRTSNTVLPPRVKTHLSPGNSISKETRRSNSFQQVIKNLPQEKECDLTTKRLSVGPHTVGQQG